MRAGAGLRRGAGQGGKGAGVATEKKEKKGPLARLFPILVVAALLAGFYLAGLHRYFTLDSIQDNHEAIDSFCRTHFGATLFVFVAAYAAAVAISFPGASIMTILGGYLFGVVIGSVAVVIAATTGAVIVFLVARSAAGDNLSRRLGGFAAKLEDGFRKDAFSYLLTLRLIPLVPFWALNIAPALFGTPLRSFAVATAIGIIPGTIVFVSIGNGLGAAIEAGEDLALDGILTKPEILLPIVGLAALSLLPVLYKRFVRKSDGSAAESQA